MKLNDIETPKFILAWVTEVGNKSNLGSKGREFIILWVSKYF